VQVCLAVNQASSIQNFGVTCESFTLGHNPHKLGLTASAVFLPTTRKLFFSEWALGDKLSRGLSAGAMLGLLSHVHSSRRPDSPTKPAAPAAPSPSHFEKIPPLDDQSFWGEWMLHDPKLAECSNERLMERQALVQGLYEGRCASLERFVSFLVLFHAMGKAVQDFWPAASCGLLGYDMSRSHSIMRIATTASPVSGSEVRHKMLELADETRRKWAVRTLQIFVRAARRAHPTPPASRLCVSCARM
jgi:hypothetical protein